jgi:Tat protein secretion system quality control protein TatD with DNase activity
MTDSHCHNFPRVDDSLSCRFVSAITQNDWGKLETLEAPNVPFFGVHPWHAETIKDLDLFREELFNVLQNNSSSGVGETGLDRLKDKTITPLQRSLFSIHLEVASSLNRPIVIHGAKCWGETFKECAKYTAKIPSFLFHGFSRSGGLIKDIVAINGYFSIGPSLLNDHAINYHKLVKEIPLDRILIESDYDGTKEVPPLLSIVEKLSSLVNIPFDSLLNHIEENSANFLQ